MNQVGEIITNDKYYQNRKGEIMLTKSVRRRKE
jgi:hypothetical protein